MILLLLFSDLSVAAASAVSEVTPRASSSQDDSNLCGGGRLMFNIVWGCLSTIFLCAWVSVHPNIPEKRRLEGIFRRFQLLFWMLVAPDLILVLAMRQWVAAGRIADAYNNTKLKASKRKLPTWTRAHGHFIVMGGLTLISPRSESADGQDEPDASDSVGQVMSYEQFLHFVNDPTFDFPIITEDDINDRTRGDILSKSVAVLQTTWFVVQCIARAIQRLALTELELTTLALCSVSLVTYFFWWHKPLDAKTQIRVYLKPGQSPPLRNLKDDDAASFDSQIGIAGRRGRRRYLDRIKNIVANILASFRLDRTESLTASILSNSFFLILNLFYLLSAILLFPAVLLFNSFHSVVQTEAVPRGASHVPPFYTPDVYDTVAGVAFAIFGAAFGGIHLIGWNFTYPTLIERMLWRVSAMLITVIPPYAVFVEHLARYSWGEKLRRREIRGLGPRFVLLLVFITVFMLILYIFARISLLVQSFVLLRRQPASAFSSVNWLTFFPHLS